MPPSPLELWYDVAAAVVHANEHATVRARNRRPRRAASASGGRREGQGAQLGGHVSARRAAQIKGPVLAEMLDDLPS